MKWDVFAPAFVVGCVPVVWDAPPSATLAWAGSLIFGGVVAGKVPLRWVAVGWAAAVAVPGFPFAAAAAAGHLLSGLGAHPMAAVVGVLLSTLVNLLPVPRPVHFGGTLFFIVAATIVWIQRKNI